MSYLVWESVNCATVGAVLGRALEEGLELAGLRSACLKGDQKSEVPQSSNPTIRLCARCSEARALNWARPPGGAFRPFRSRRRQVSC